MRPTIFLIHGMWCSAWVWLLWKAEFEALGYEVVVITLPGHEPEGYLDDATIELCKMSAYREMARRGQPAILIGHSFGALVAEQVAQTSKYAKATVLVAGVPPQGTKFPFSANVALARYGVQIFGTEQPFALSEEHRQRFFLNDVSNAEELNEKFGKESSLIAKEIFVRQFGSSEPLSRRLPTLFVGGYNDRIAPYKRIEAEAAQNQSKLIAVKAGHMFPADPDYVWVTHAIVAWFEEAGLVPRQTHSRPKAA